MVGNGKKYDLKNTGDWNDWQFFFDGYVIAYDAPGNILYGFFGKAIGIDEETLLSAAGIAQLAAGTSKLEYYDSRFDDPRDQEMIKLGFEYYDKGLE